MINTLKKTVSAAAVGVSSLCFVGVAHAVVDTPGGASFGTLSADSSLTFSGHQNGGNINLSADGQDKVTFSVLGSFDSDSSAISSKLGASGWKSFATSLWSGTTELVAGTVLANDPVLGKFTSSFSFSPLNNAGSPYSIHIDGVTLAHSSHASYAGTLDLVAIPVPEPETYAMMLAGLGLMGFIARRRRERDVA